MRGEVWIEVRAYLIVSGQTGAVTEMHSEGQSRSPTGDTKLSRSI
jgi:hypothetical protein